MKTKNILIALLLATTFFSCSEDDNDFLIAKGENNDVHIENSVYTHQTFYDLGTNSAVLVVDNDEWDLSVETSGSMQAILLNPSKGYRVFKTSSTDITEEIILPEVPDWNFDDPAYDPAKTAFFGWKNNEVFVIGKKEESFNPTQPSINVYAKVSFEKTGNSVKIEWVIAGETEVHEAEFAGTAEAHPFTWFSFETGGAASVQPPSPGDYDVIFTTYTGSVADGSTSYILDFRGALTNRGAEVLSYRYHPGDADENEYTYIFNNLTKDDVDEAEFKADANVLGYSWKYFNRHEMIYEIDKSNMYFVKDGSGNYYKLRFTNFYDEGVKGYVSFSFALL